MSVNPPGNPNAVPDTPQPAPQPQAPVPQGVVLDAVPVAWQAVCYITDQSGNRVVAWQSANSHANPKDAVGEAQAWLTRQVPHP